MTNESTTVEAGLQSALSSDVSATANVQAGNQAISQLKRPRKTIHARRVTCLLSPAKGVKRGVKQSSKYHKDA